MPTLVSRQLLLIMLSTTLCFSASVSITGVVKERKTGSPVSGAAVALVKHPGLTATTGDDGKFSLGGTVGVAGSAVVSGWMNPVVDLRNGAIVLDNLRPGRVGITLFDACGRQVYSQKQDAKTFGMVITPGRLSDGVYIVKVTGDMIDTRCRVLSVGGRFVSIPAPPSSLASAIRSAKKAAVIDTLKVTKAGYVTDGLPLSGYTVSDTAIYLDPLSSKPNVVFVLVDDLGYGDLACHGNGWVRTPAIDSFYGEAVRLTDFHMSPTCSPTRASLMTGRYSNATGVWHTILQRDQLRLDEWTLAQAFQGGGYETGIFGKWHLGDAAGYRPEERGFDTAVVGGFGGNGQTGDFWGNRYGVNHDDSYFVNGIPKKFHGYCTDVFFGEAMKFIEENRTRPFFCFIPANVVHVPVENNVPDSYYRHFKGMKGVPDNRAYYYGMIENLDENFARLRGKLSELGLAENTILVFSSDNGAAGNVAFNLDGSTGLVSGPNGGFNAGMRGHKGMVYEGGHRMPFFIRWPSGDISGGWDVPDLAAHIDLFPTMLDLCGIPDAERTFHGTSLAGRLKGGEMPELGERILVVDNQRSLNLVKYKQFAVMQDKWRLIGDGGPGNRLYDVSQDPGQQKNVISANPSVAKTLKDAYEEWWTLVSARKNEPSPVVFGDLPTEFHVGDFRQTKGATYAHMQFHIRDGVKVQGYWEVRIDKPGKYRFEIRRWPREADAPMRGKLQDGTGTALGISDVLLKLQGQTVRKPVGASDKYVLDTLTLETGNADLTANFVIGGKTRAAYFLYVEPVR